jgi:hypothetical protein
MDEWPHIAELERIGIRIVVYPQDILAASVRACATRWPGWKGGTSRRWPLPPNWQRPSVSPNI